MFVFVFQTYFAQFIVAFNCCLTPSIRSFVAVGVGPAVMGVGPAVAIPAVVKSAGLEIGDIDLFELNEVCVNCLDVHPLLSPIYL